MKLRSTVLVTFAAIGLIGTVATPGTLAATKAKPKVGLVFDIGGRGDQSFNDSAAKGLDFA
jgi:basic membrane protein A and related proteins